jgi:predicted enzyme related to lactoylglutathione lyase
MRLITQHTVISVLVPDQDEALRFYTEQLGMEKRTDITYAPGMRLLTVALYGQHKPEIALAHPEPSLHGEERVRELMSAIGHASPWLFVTDNCRAEYEQLQARGVKFLSEPTRQLYGLQAIFADLYGNTFVLLEATPEVRVLLDRRSINSAA